MNLKLELMIAWRYLRSKRKEGFISVIALFSFIGIMLGVATLIVVMAVMQGFREEITSKILGLNGHINVSYAYDSSLKDFVTVSFKLKQIRGILKATPIIDGQVMATSYNKAIGAMVKGIRIEDLQDKSFIKKNIIAGNLAAFTKADGLVVGVELARNLGIGVGDNIKLISPNGTNTILGTIPRIKTYKISAIFNSGMYEYDSSFIFMPLNIAQIFFQYPPDRVTYIEVLTDNPDKTNIYTNAIINKLGNKFFAQDWQTMNSTLFNALKVKRTVMFLILTLIVFIAAFNIISSLIMLVNDKRKYIAVLRTMGASQGMIMRIFFICGSSIGIIGTFAGFILGVGFASNIDRIKRLIESLTGNKLFDPVLYFLSELPAKIEMSNIIMSVSLGIILSFLATIYPALKAARQEPVEVLRYE